MAGLMNRTEQRRSGLQRAGDADTDPATISASRNESTNAVQQDSPHDGVNDADETSVNNIDNADDSDSASRGDNDISTASTKASDTATLITGGSASDPARVKAGVTSAKTASRKSGRKAGQAGGGKAGRPRRGVGRPPGPERQAITVRVLAEHDALLTEAWNEQGMRPQQVIDAALAEWFDGHLRADRR